MAVYQIGVGKGDQANSLSARRHILDHSAASDGAPRDDSDGVIGAGDGYGDGRPAERTVGQSDCVGEVIRRGFTGREIIQSVGVVSNPSIGR